MPWKLEKWITEVYPQSLAGTETFKNMSHRELAILASAELDIAIAEMLAKRLREYPNEVIEFLGASEDGRAPCGSFGARIQLALLIGVIEPTIAIALRNIKNIRNKFSHRVNIGFDSPSVLPQMESLAKEWMVFMQVFTTEKNKMGPDLIEHLQGIAKEPADTIAQIFLAIFMIYRDFLRSRYDNIAHIKEVSPSLEELRDTIQNAKG